jgi:hypothetical protein
VTHVRLLRTACALFAVVLVGCASFPAPSPDASSAAARAVLEAAADGHGWSAYRALADISIAYEGEWLSIAPRVQPVLIDSQFRGKSEERLLVAAQAIGQTHRGPGGVKQVARDPQGTRVWYNGVETADAETLRAAALVADGYRLFLFGPMFLRERDATVELLPYDVIDGRPFDRVYARLRPGFGAAQEDRVILWIDRDTRLVRKLWMSLEGLASTQGAVVEVDLLDYREFGGVQWPTRFFERVLRPLPIDVHQWRVTGLDVNRGFAAQDILGGAFMGAATRPATPLAGP